MTDRTLISSESCESLYNMTLYQLSFKIRLILISLRETVSYEKIQSQQSVSLTRSPCIGDKKETSIPSWDCGLDVILPNLLSRKKEKAKKEP